MPALTGIPQTVLVAPDSFKGTFSAVEVADLVGRGLESMGLPVERCPLADGGEGTVAALAAAMGAERHEAEVEGPLGDPVRAPFALAGDVGLVECAAASGLGLVREERRDAVAAHTRGTGQLLVAAARAGARRVLLGVGGSATTDGGRGAVEAVREAGGLGHARVVVLCDVRTPFEQAARVFSPQKGAGPEQVQELGRRLEQLAGEMERDPRGVPMTGAAGGLAGGLWSELGAELVAGAPYVLDAVGFDARMRAARAVVTGEGKLDEQSLAGKVISEVATRTRQAGVPCHAVVGRLELDRFGLRILDLQAVIEAGEEAGLEAAGRTLGELLQTGG